MIRCTLQDREGLTVAAYWNAFQSFHVSSNHSL